jgi:hypothetical protein
MSSGKAHPGARRDHHNHRKEGNMTAPKPKPIGTAVEVRDGATVVRPDRSEITVTGGLYVLDVPGEHTVDGKTIAASVDADETAPSA